jgi:hypothetical protein
MSTVDAAATRLLRMIRENYPHRIDADPKFCPVCCGDGVTSDQRFGGDFVRFRDEGTHNEVAVRSCTACAVWAARHERIVGRARAVVVGVLLAFAAACGESPVEPEPLECWQPVYEVDTKTVQLTLIDSVYTCDSFGAEP